MPIALFAESAPPVSKDRRGSARHRMFGKVSLPTDQSAPPKDAIIRDISLTGCYLLSPEPIPVDSKVVLQFNVSGRAFEMKGVVLRSDSGLGMAVAFA